MYKIRVSFVTYNIEKCMQPTKENCSADAFVF